MRSIDFVMQHLEVRIIMHVHDTHSYLPLLAFYSHLFAFSNERYV